MLGPGNGRQVREELRQQLDTCRGLDTYESGDKSPSNLSRAEAWLLSLPGFACVAMTVI